jgi:hypothetical protein
MLSLVAQSNVKVEEPRVLQRGVRCMLDAVHSVNGGDREPNALFLSFFLSFVLLLSFGVMSVPPRRATQGMTHKSLHPEPEVFQTVRPLSQGRTRSAKEHMANRVRWPLVVRWEVA